METKSNPPPMRWTEILAEAISKPGTISAAYSAFHGYSIGNQVAALCQCWKRGIQPGPICTFKGWLSKGRGVRKGEKALVLCMPISCKAKDKPVEGAVAKAADSDGRHFQLFVWKPRWFVLSQTDGADYVPAVHIPNWDKTLALSALKIAEIPFDMLNGNCMGFATHRNIAISPLATLPHKTTFHELAHVVLGHTTERCDDNEATPRTLREVEAESVALILCETLGLAGATDARGYIQHWLAAHGGQEIPEKSAQRIFKAADSILKAGQPAKVEAPAEV